MATPASLLAHRDEPVERAGHRAAHEQQVALGVHLDHPEAQLGEAACAHVAGHPLAFDDARRIGAGSDRPGLAVPRVAVGLGAPAEVMAVHHALEAATLGHARDLYAVALREDRHRHALARLRRLALRAQHEALQHARRRLAAGLLHVAGQGFGGALRLLDAKAELDLRARHLHHRARARFDHRDGHVRALGVEHARHAQLATNQSGHYWTLISTSTPAGRSSLVSASIVCERESRMSISRLCVFSSNCSRLFLSMCGLRSTVHSCRLVGSGIGPETWAPVFSAVRTMSAAAWSISAWSNALRRMRILPAIGPRTRYFLIFVTTPAPTVRPPSRIAKRRPSSIAIGVMSSIAIFVLSPGITISTPAGSSTVPVTSVVRR